MLQMMGKEVHPRVFAVCPLLYSVSGSSHVERWGNRLGRVRGRVGSSQAALGWNPGFLFSLLVTFLRRPPLLESRDNNGIYA